MRKMEEFMIQAVIFDMYETLITHYRSPLYFGAQMAADAGITEEAFQVIWQQTEIARSTGKLTFEDVIENILQANQCYSKAIYNKIIEKRYAAKRESFRHLHPEILPMLAQIKENGLQIGVISNCFSEETKVIRESVLFPYFDVVFLSYEQGLVKPDKEIFYRCLQKLSVKAEECLYVGDGGSQELETAKALGMRAVQAVGNLQEGTEQPSGRKPAFRHMETPLAVMQELQ